MEPIRLTKEDSLRTAEPAKIRQADDSVVLIEGFQSPRQPPSLTCIRAFSTSFESMRSSAIPSFRSLTIRFSAGVTETIPSKNIQYRVLLRFLENSLDMAPLGVSASTSLIPVCCLHPLKKGTSMIRKIAVVSALLLSPLCFAQAPAGAPAGSTAQCNDGTYFSGATKSGACRGHKGIKTWYGAPAAATTSTPSKTAPTTSSKTSTPAPAPAPAATNATAPAGATAQCNDGTYFTGATKSGACRGHKGIKTWFGATTAAAPASKPAPAPAPAPVAAPAPAPAPAPAAASTPQSTGTSTKTPLSAKTAAPGGGPGLVWLNTGSNVYHCPGSQYYGKTKAGAYMSEADAKAKGGRPDAGRPCK